MQKLSKEEIKRRLNCFGYDYIEDYDGNRKVVGETPDHYKVILDYTRLRHPKKIVFSKSNPFIIENIKMFLLNNNIDAELLSDTYINNTSLLTWKCKCGTIFERDFATFSSAKNSHLCNDCSKRKSALKRAKHTVGSIKDIFEQIGCTLVNESHLCDDDYIPEKTKVKYVCNKHKSKGIMETSIENILSGKGCPICGRIKAAKSRRIPESELKIRVENKGLEYAGVNYSSRYSRILYVCPKHRNVGVQSASYSSISKQNYCCPYCANERFSSSLERKVKNYFESKNYTVNVENHCSLKPYNPITNRPLPYDNEVVELRLIVEVNGEQHYRENSKLIYMVAKRDGITPKEAFERRKKYDLYKMQYALQHGYNYLVIPFWAEQNDEYKQLIDDEILKLTS